MSHLIERRCYQPAQPHRVGRFVTHGLEDPLGRHHHAKVHYLVVVTAQDDTNDVLTDVVYVAFDCGHDELAIILTFAPFTRFLCFDERCQIANGLLHYTC